jgi:hypothetical protein
MTLWQKLISGRVVFALGFFTLLLAAVLMSKPFGTAEIEERIGLAPLEGRMGYTAGEVYEVIRAIDQNARVEYIFFLILDFVFITLYGVFFAASLYFFLQRLFPAHPTWAKLFWLGILTAVVDTIEGLLFMAMVLFYPVQMPALANLAGIITPLKLLLFSLCAALLVAIFTAWLIQSLLRRRLNTT